ncbi:MAG: hypothetical protein MJD61_13825, partial [Proteobacteria bacterium]|nr:hypothetical protein [Pseudomonadota bacterium]
QLRKPWPPPASRLRVLPRHDFTPVRIDPESCTLPGRWCTRLGFGASPTETPGGVSDMEIIDVTVDPGQRAHGLALATRQQPDRSFVHRLAPRCSKRGLLPHFGE